MKKFKLFVLFILPLVGLSQTFQNNFYNLEVPFNNVPPYAYPSCAPNSGNRIHVYNSHIMESYIMMYRATGNTVYLDLFLVYAKKLLTGVTIIF